MPTPDPKIAELARQQAREGKGCTIQEFLEWKETENFADGCQRRERFHPGCSVCPERK